LSLRKIGPVQLRSEGLTEDPDHGGAAVGGSRSWGDNVKSILQSQYYGSGFRKKKVLFYMLSLGHTFKVNKTQIIVGAV
jgi:hypothetical protein